MIEFKKISRAALILVLAGLALIATVPVWAQTTGWVDPPNNPPSCTDPNIPGCNPPINTADNTQVKKGSLQVNNSLYGGFLLGQLGKITQSDYVLPANLHFGVNGNIGANKYCDLTGTVCKSISELGGGSGSWTVTPSGNNQYSSLPGTVAIGLYGNSVDNPNFTNRSKLVVQTSTDDKVAYFENSGAAPSGTTRDGLVVKTLSNGNNTKILDLRSGNISSVASKFSVLGDGKVCIGDPTVADNCRSGWLKINSQCFTADPNTTKMVWDAAGNQISCIDEMIGGGSGVAGVSSLTAGTGISTSAATGAVTVSMDINKLTQGGTPPQSGQIAVYDPALGIRKYPVSSFGGSGGSGGDNLGNHTATLDLNMQNKAISFGNLRGESGHVGSIIAALPGGGQGLTFLSTGNLAFYANSSLGENGQALVSNGVTTNWGAVKNNGLNLTTTKYSASASGVSSDTETMGNYNFCGLSRVDRASGAVVGEPYGECKIDRTGGNAGNWVLVATSRDSASGITCEAYCF